MADAPQKLSHVVVLLSPLLKFNVLDLLLRLGHKYIGHNYNEP